MHFGAALENKVLCVCVMMVMMMMSLSTKRARERSILINHDWLIQSPLVFSPAPALPLSFMAWLRRRILSLIPQPLHPSLFFSRFSLYPPHPPLRLFIHPSLGKEAVNLRLPPLHPLTCRTSLHLSLHPSIYLSHPSLSLSFTLFSPFLSLSQSFLPPREFLQDKFTLSFQRLPVFIFVPHFSSSAFSDLSFPLYLSGTIHTIIVKKTRIHNLYIHLYIFALSVCRHQLKEQPLLTQSCLIQMLPEMHHGKFPFFFFLVFVAVFVFLQFPIRDRLRIVNGNRNQTDENYLDFNSQRSALCLLHQLCLGSSALHWPSSCFFSLLLIFFQLS